MQLTNPAYLLLALIPLGLYLRFRLSKPRPSTRSFWIGYPLRHLTRRSKWPFYILYGVASLAFALWSWALAGPYLLNPSSKIKSEGIDLVILMDISESMEADDFAPRRIEVAKKVIRTFVERRKSDRIGLIVFSGDTLVKAPLTLDYDFLLAQLEKVETGEMKQGTAIGMGILSAVNRLHRSTRKNKVIVLLTDGDSNVGAVNPITASVMARQENIRIYPIGIGQKDRVLVPIYAKDGFGIKRQVLAQVPSYLNPELLKNIARLTGGKAYMARDPNSLNQMMMEIDALEKSKAITLRHFKKEDIYTTPLVLGFLLFCIVLLLLETRYRRVYPC